MIFHGHRECSSHPSEFNNAKACYQRQSTLIAPFFHIEIVLFVPLVRVNTSTALMGHANWPCTDAQPALSCCSAKTQVVKVESKTIVELYTSCIETRLPNSQKNSIKQLALRRTRTKSYWRSKWTFAVRNSSTQILRMVDEDFGLGFGYDQLGWLGARLRFPATPTTSKCMSL